MPLVCVVEHHQKPSLNVVELLFLISFVEFGMFFYFYCCCFCSMFHALC